MPGNFLVRSKLVKAGKKLKREDIQHLKYILKDHFGDGALEKITNGTELFDLLEQNGIFTLDDFSPIIDLMDAVDRNDIAIQLGGKAAEKNLKVKVSNVDIEPCVETETSIPFTPALPSEVLDLISNLLAADWKRCARFLGVEEHSIDSIECDYRKTSERALQSLHLWSKAQTEQGSWVVLKTTALKKIPRYDIIRDVERKFPKVLSTERPSTTVLYDSNVHEKYSNPALTPTDLNEVASGVPKKEEEEQHNKQHQRITQGTGDERDLIEENASNSLVLGRNVTSPEELVNKTDGLSIVDKTDSLLTVDLS